MKTKTSTQHSEAFLKQRRFLVGLPVVIVPFITLLFWFLDGGAAEKTGDVRSKSGLKLELPSASLEPDSALDKMAFYERAEHDSLKRLENLKNDPYYQGGGAPSTDLAANSADPNELRVNEKLRQLNSALSTANMPVSGTPTTNRSSFAEDPKENRADLKRLEQMMSSMQDNGGGDPEMQQINSMLNQILDIQHPDRVQQRLKESSVKNRGQVLVVRTTVNENAVSMLDKQPKEKIAPVTGFYSIEEPEKETQEQNAIEAAIYETQTVSSGSILKLKLLNDVYISGQLIPKNTFVFGVAAVNGERLMINVSNIKFGNSLFPVDLSVYDLDGLDGLYIPGAISRDVSKASADQALQGVTMGASLDPSIGVQAMGAGIEAAKSLLSKKVKLVKVTVKAGYFVLLKNKNENKTN